MVDAFAEAACNVGHGCYFRVDDKLKKGFSTCARTRSQNGADARNVTFLVKFNNWGFCVRLWSLGKDIRARVLASERAPPGVCKTPLFLFTTLPRTLPLLLLMNAGKERTYKVHVLISGPLHF